MIRVKATVKGEPDTKSFTTIFDYDDKVFFASAISVREKIRRGFKINVNEALIVYCEYVVNSVRDKKKDNVIQKEAAQILVPDNVMIGVPETLQSIKFQAEVDNKFRKVVIRKPILTTGYMFTGS